MAGAADSLQALRKSFRAALKEKPAAPSPVPVTSPAAETENAFAFDAESVGDLELIPVNAGLRYQPRRSGGLKWAMVAGIIGTLVAIGGGVYYKNTNAGAADADANVDRSSEATVASTAESAKTLDLPKAATNFPRRFLAVSIHNYLYANPVSSRGDRTGMADVLRVFAKDKLRVDPTQIYILSDAVAGKECGPRSSRLSSRRSNAFWPRPAGKTG